MSTLHPLRTQPHVRPVFFGSFEHPGHLVILRVVRTHVLLSRANHPQAQFQFLLSVAVTPCIPQSLVPVLPPDPCCPGNLSLPRESPQECSCVPALKFPEMEGMPTLSLNSPLLQLKPLRKHLTPFAQAFLQADVPRNVRFQPNINPANQPTQFTYRCPPDPVDSRPRRLAPQRSFASPPVPATAECPSGQQWPATERRGTAKQNRPVASGRRSATGQAVKYTAPAVT